MEDEPNKEPNSFSSTKSFNIANHIYIYARARASSMKVALMDGCVYFIRHL